jgi:hypothetical protein
LYSISFFSNKIHFRRD